MADTRYWLVNRRVQRISMQTLMVAADNIDEARSKALHKLGKVIQDGTEGEQVLDMYNPKIMEDDDIIQRLLSAGSEPITSVTSASSDTDTDDAPPTTDIHITTNQVTSGGCGCTKPLIVAAVAMLMLVLASYFVGAVLMGSALIH